MYEFVRNNDWQKRYFGVDSKSVFRFEFREKTPKEKRKEVRKRLESLEMGMGPLKDAGFDCNVFYQFYKYVEGSEIKAWFYSGRIGRHYLRTTLRITSKGPGEFDLNEVLDLESVENYVLNGK